MTPPFLEGGRKREQITFCRICEPLCGLVATVVDGKLVGVRGDKENPLSQGFMCAKAAGMVDITYDPDRVLHPLRRKGAPGDFEEVPWDEALDDIASRLREIVRRHGRRAFASFIGNPPFFTSEVPLALEGFQKAIGSPLKYSIGGEDSASRMVALNILYGSPALLNMPDFWRSHFVLMLGANPFVSKGSVMSEPLVRQALHSVVERGGRVIVVDPRRTETAKQFEHLPLRAGTDAWFLLGILYVLLQEELIDEAFLARHTTGFERLAELLGGFPPQECGPRCGIPPDTIVDVARSFAAAPSGVVYGRTGTCTQRFGTLNNLLQDMVMILTGKLERPGGMVFGWGPIDMPKFARYAGMDSYGKRRTRIRQLPDVFGLLPSQGFAEDIATPGPDRIRALLLLGGNPVITSGVARELEGALDQLDLHFSLDLYVNETNRYADYILPVPTFYEREDLPFTLLGNMLRPTIFATDPVIERRGSVRGEWEILDDLARRMGLGGAQALAPLRWLARAGLRLRPKTVVDVLLRTSSVGDWFGMRPRGLSWKKLLAKYPHGVRLREELPSGQLHRKLRTPGKRIPLAPPVLEPELRRLRAHTDDPEYPLRVIGQRQMRSHNSWTHNVARLVPDDWEPSALIHPADAAHAGVEEGQLVRITSKSGSITMRVSLTDDMTPGNVAVPHGYGHNGGWRRANRAGGAKSNLLVSTETEDIEPLAAMSILNGIPVRIAPERT